jgi:ATP-binding cassette, subfamily G (WHITE), member 1
MFLSCFFIVLAVPIMLLSVYGIGSGKNSIPIVIRFCMSLSYLRHGLEGIIQSIYGFNRNDMICPPQEKFCPYKKPEFLLRIMGFEDLNINVSITALVLFYLVFNFTALLLIKNRLSVRGHSFWPVRFVSRFVKNYLNMAPYS